jgi:hypothetical protein
VGVQSAVDQQIAGKPPNTVRGGLPRRRGRPRRKKDTDAILLFGQFILELLRAHRPALVVQKLAVERRPPLDSIGVSPSACPLQCAGAPYHAECIDANNRPYTQRPAARVLKVTPQKLPEPKVWLIRTVRPVVGR